MARENQGLQIALIVFVMLTVLLGVTTYLGFRQYDDAATKAKTLAAENGKLNSDKAAKDDDIAKLKRCIFGGAAPAESVDPGITKLFTEDMTKYGAGYPAESLFYHLLVEKMKKTIDEKGTQLADARADFQKQADAYKVSLDAMAPQLKKFEEERDKAAKDLASEQAKFKAERDRINEEKSKLEADLQKVRTDAKSEKDVVVAERAKAEATNKKRLDQIERMAIEIDVLSGRDKRIESADGKVVWANQREGTVTINLGRADSLMRQVTFAVYPAGLINLSLKEKKASIEVTQILGDHLAEARVLDDQPANPIMPGDKIHTVLWSPGEKRHFALAGLIDIDDDGRSDLQTVMNLIKANGGVVDAYIADSGKDKNKQQGEITVNTNYLIMGAAPTEKGDPGQLAAFTKMLRDADQFRIPTMQLGDMLQGMGWRNLTPVVRYGRGINPDDFRAKPEEGGVKKSTGSHTEAFEKRAPPATRTPSNSYYRF